MPTMKNNIFNFRLNSRIRRFTAWLAAALLFIASMIAAAPWAPAAGGFTGGVLSAASGVLNPVAGVFRLSIASYSVGQKYGVGWGIAYGAGSLVGMTQATQLIAGENFATGQYLVGADRWSMGFQAVSAASGAAAFGLGAADFNPTIRLSDWLRSGANVAGSATSVVPPTARLFNL